MLLGIIKEETHNESYYINLERKNNKNELSIIHTCDDRVESLSKEKAIELLKTLLSSKLTYSTKEDDYDIYLDEANNKRYFKNGRENYFMSLEKNGTDAIMYLDKISKYQSSTTKKLKIACGVLSFALVLSSAGLLYLIDDTVYVDAQDQIFLSISPVTASNLAQEVKNSPYLTDEEKELLANKVYFEFLLRNTKSADRQIKLRNSLKNINIKSYTKEEFKGAEGYYDTLDINTIHVLDTVKAGRTYKDVVAHEFIHLTQDINDYIYIEEACAEIVEYEFFNQPCNGYSDMVKRVKILMEIIGPQPIIDCNFKGDTKSFEDSIKKYLSEEDAYKLLKLFSTTAQDQYKTKDSASTNNKEIDELLSKMYTNKTGKSIKSDKMIMKISRDNPTSRIYFNPNHEDYDKDFEIVEARQAIAKAKIEDVINSDNVLDYSYVSIQELKIGDKIKKNYIAKRTKDFDSIPLENLRYVNINFKDGTSGNVIYNKSEKKWEDVEIYGQPNVDIVPSIVKKFPDQIQQKIVFEKGFNYDDMIEKSM